MDPDQTRELRGEPLDEHVKRLFGERERVARLGRIRQFMFGSLDGLLVPLGVVSGVAGGTANSKIVVIAGVAEAFAGALSMGAGEFLSGRAEAQVAESQIRDEQAEIDAIPGVEKYEIELLFRNEGLSDEDARIVAEKITSSPRSWTNTMVEKELGLTAEPEGNLLSDSLVMGFSYMGASLVPLSPYIFLPVGIALPISMAVTIAVLFVIGIIKGRVVKTNLLLSALEVAVIGTVSALGGYLLGTVLPHLMGGL